MAPKSFLEGEDLESYLKKQIKSHLKSEKVQIITAKKKVMKTGRHSFEFTFSLEDLPIPGFHIKAHKMPSGDLVMMGEVPQGRYEISHFNQHKLPVTTPQTRMNWVKDYLAEEDPNFDPQALQLIHSSPCILITEGYFIPGTCLALMYKKKFIEAHLSTDKIHKLMHRSAHFCGYLQDVHTLSPETDTKTFAVDLCDEYPTRDVLANERFVFEGLNNCASTPPLPYAAEQLKGLPNPNPASVSSIDTSRDGVFSYTEAGSLGFRMIHAFAHLNRMMDWFEVHGFRQDKKDVVRVFVEEEGENNASYSGIGVGSEIYYHFITFGPDHPEGMINLATDFDISAHELSHFVIGQDIPPYTPAKGAAAAEFVTLAVHEGLADYFTYAASGDDCMGESACPEGGPPCGPSRSRPRCMRTAEPLLPDGSTPFLVYGNEIYDKFNAPGGSRGPIYHQLGQLVSGYLWRVRKELSTEDKKKFDTMVYNSLSYQSHSRVKYLDIIVATLLSDKELDSNQPFCSSLVRSAQVYFEELDILSQSRVTTVLTDSCLSASSQNAYSSMNANISTDKLPEEKEYDPAERDYSVSQAFGLACNDEEVADLALLSGITLEEDGSEVSRESAENIAQENSRGEAVGGVLERRFWLHSLPGSRSYFTHNHIPRKILWPPRSLQTTLAFRSSLSSVYSTPYTSQMAYKRRTIKFIYK